MGVRSIQDSTQSGAPREADDLLPLVYEELRKLAKAKMAGERSDHTLDATALVHEAYLKLAGGPDRDVRKWNGRRHFYAAAAEAMRRVLIDYARRKQAIRRGGDLLRVTLGDHKAQTSATPSEIIDLNAAMDKLADAAPDKAEVAKLRLFGGLKVVEIAEVLGVSKATAARRWSYAECWLSREIGKERS